MSKMTPDIAVDPEENASGASLAPLVVGSILIGGTWLLTPWLVAKVVATDWAVRGQVGDTFGAVNSLFSGLAFAGIIYTILLQRKELSLQRRELELTRRELTRSATAQERSETALQAQVAALQATARLTALATAVQHYSLVIESAAGTTARTEAERKRLEYLKAIEAELGTLGRDSVPLGVGARDH